MFFHFNYIISMLQLVIIFYMMIVLIFLPMVEVVTTIRYPEQNAVNISCRNTSIIQIQNISVHAEKTSCGPNQCVLNSIDTQTIEDNCNGASSCLMDYNFTSACLRSLRYINLSYTCKHGIKYFTIFYWVLIIPWIWRRCRINMLL